MKQVFKYPVTQNPIEMPSDSKVIHFAMQNGQAMLWAEVGVLNVKHFRDIRIYGTGMGIPEDAIHLGTCLDGEFVWHLYERI